MSEQQKNPVENPTYMPNGVLNFFISFIPGAGQMYQGLLQRGMTLMACFCGFITITVTLGMLNIYGVGSILMGVSITGIVISYFYSFFDSMRTCRLIRSGMSFAEQMNALDVDFALPRFQAVKNSRVIFGAVLTMIGALGLLSYILNRFVPYEIIANFVRPAFEIMLPLAFLIVGVILLVKGKNAKKQAD